MKTEASEARERPAPRERALLIPCGPVQLTGDLVMPEQARSLIVFAHGSGSSRKSPRNRFVARTLSDRGLGTLLFDLLTPDEEQEDVIDARLRFDISLLSRRLGLVTDYLQHEAPFARGRSLGYFGASTGAAAALIAAAERPETIGAVVSRGGRPDLAGAALRRLRAPTLLIVGADDTMVLELNESALRQISGPKHLEVVPGASHLFEEPGALERVAHLAAAWFERHLAGPW